MKVPFCLCLLAIMLFHKIPLHSQVNIADKNQFELHGNIRVMKEYTHKASLDEGKVNKTWMLPDAHKTTFNSEGNIVKRVIFDSSGLIAETEITEYDELKRKTHTTTLDAELGTQNKCLYFYNSLNMLQEKQYFDNEIFILKNEYIYDTLNRIIQEKISNNEHLQDIFLFKYDDKNKVHVFLSDSTETIKLVRTDILDDHKRLKSQTYYNSDDTWYSISIRYNSNSFREEISTSHSQGVESKKRYEYTYDRKGNWKTRIEFENNIPIFVVERKLRYGMYLK